MASLKDTFIADTYPYLLHTRSTQISSGGQAQVFDGGGFATSLTVGLSGSGVSVSGQLSASGISYPTSDPGAKSLMVSDGNKVLSLSSLGDLLRALGGAGNGTYTNPTITITDGVIGPVTSNVTGGLSSFTTSGERTFTVPPNVRKIKFTITGGGGYASSRTGGAGGTIIGYMPVTPSTIYGINVGEAGTSGSIAGGTSYISLNNNTIAYATGGNSSMVGSLNSGGGEGVVSIGSLISSHVTIRGGDGGFAVVGENDRESSGASSYWGNGPAYGGGQGSTVSGRIGTAGGGIVLLEW